MVACFIAHSVLWHRRPFMRLSTVGLRWPSGDRRAKDCRSISAKMNIQNISEFTVIDCGTYSDPLLDCNSEHILGCPSHLKTSSDSSRSSETTGGVRSQHYHANDETTRSADIYNHDYQYYATNGSAQPTQGPKCGSIRSIVYAILDTDKFLPCLKFGFQ